ncbi:questionable protein [Neurospora tetrasperma FGSC 2508]|uniref:Questionable protein n=1 Tax=Neurospora tetrasperma (strain FGSC 2508 / ATCC MYA-4615 / P0657) TaxID=510951 RepID=F8MCX9_NEUT8|nr:uncharacterized protein NEUTE1DRAFT_97690 [Neurospora tetrasperma FGSC 2508]EGO60523.1 questionable protein [Neurospora tetrasperma FGSC 2508]
MPAAPHVDGFKLAAAKVALCSSDYDVILHNARRAAGAAVTGAYLLGFIFMASFPSPGLHAARAWTPCHAIHCNRTIHGGVKQSLGTIVLAEESSTSSGFTNSRSTLQAAFAGVNGVVRTWQLRRHMSGYLSLTCHQRSRSTEAFAELALL